MRPGAASAPLCVLGYSIMPSDIVRNGKSVPAGALSSNNMMLPLLIRRYSASLEYAGG